MRPAPRGRRACLAIVVGTLVLIGACADDGDAGSAVGGDSVSEAAEQNEQPVTWEEIQTLSCGSVEARDHVEVAKEKSADDPAVQELLELADKHANRESRGELQYLSCNGEPPFLRLFDTPTAQQMYIQDWLLPDGCTGAAVAGDVWVVSGIQDSATASTLVEEAGGSLVSC